MNLVPASTVGNWLLYKFTNSYNGANSQSNDSKAIKLYIKGLGLLRNPRFCLSLSRLQVPGKKSPDHCQKAESLCWGALDTFSEKTLSYPLVIPNCSHSNHNTLKSFLLPILIVRRVVIVC